MIKRTLIAVLLLSLDITSAMQVSRSKLKQMLQTIASSDVKQTVHSCQAAINRIKKGPADFKSIWGSGIKYIDLDYKASADAI
jgi:hypothetical protein